MVKLIAVLPSFPGFNQTNLHYSHLFNSDGNWQDAFDHDRYQSDIGKLYTQFVNDVLELGDIGQIKFARICSPKHYNFVTDRLFCHINSKVVKKLVSYVKNNPSDFKRYLTANFGCRPGFLSSYSTDYAVWISTDIKALDHNEIGAYIDFFLQQNCDVNELENDVVEWQACNTSFTNYLNV